MSCRTTSLSVGNHWRRWDPFPFRGTSVQMTHDLALLLKQQGIDLDTRSLEASDDSVLLGLGDLHIAQEPPPS